MEHWDVKHFLSTCYIPINLSSWHYRMPLLTRCGSGRLAAKGVPSTLQSGTCAGAEMIKNLLKQNAVATQHLVHASACAEAETTAPRAAASW